MRTKTRHDWVLWAQLACALVATAHAEYTLALACGANQWVAAAVPGALDLYVIRALQKRHDVLPAVLVMVAANVTSILVRQGVLEVTWGVLAAVGAVAPLLVWRGHVLRSYSGPVKESEYVPEAPEYVTRVREYVPVAGQSPEPAPVLEPAGYGPGTYPPMPEYVPESWSTEPDTYSEKDDSPVPYLRPVPALTEYEDEIEVRVLGRAEDVLKPGDSSHVAQAEEYVATTDRPSIKGLMAYASVGQAKATRLLDYLEVRSKR